MGQAQPQAIQSPTGGCKRKRPIEDPIESPPDRERRRRITPTRTAGDTISEPGIGGGCPEPTDPISYWVENQCWPEKLKQPEEALEMDYMEYPLARKRSVSSSSRKRPSSTMTRTPTDEKPREEKSTAYRNPQFPLLLKALGSYMEASDLGITDTSEHLISALLSGEQSVPRGTLFDDDVFADACRNLKNRNEPRVIQDISRLIVPSAESLALRDRKYKCLVESVNEGWNHSIPLSRITRPQPDYSVGFKDDAFTKEQLTKLSPLVGDIVAGDRSFFMATWYMYFPFLTCEVKAGTAGLEIADRQNAHSMTLAVRGVVELFRTVKRESEVNRQILAFSVSHDHTSVRIYGHYPVISGKDTNYFRHLIHEFSIATFNGRDKWTAYRFTKNVYDIWMPKHFENICSAINQLPSDLDFNVPPLSRGTGLSQELGTVIESEAETGSASAHAERASGSTSGVGQQDVTPDTSFIPSRAGKRRKE
ncbi:hypothetical protein MYCTH_2305791 [Thermothelomyces thermophilus ATCC 42464]|uniref:DUF7924 domain-containing protein n=1 Tax=Thermothelomyces thermophilus (strain ATCC 42464 / BCRC 31852 / DSM 1799) TaxID=573729 RepID=G2QFT0_THET4|nr:uncharacterized protein MYCTH_2305791 [Thermothelomyces thermophilus ATCC 42464]AEO58448.1 hypothetical protein MYCTH_2305791 [Thermothelomyces thermophilus ATCC 42464]